MALNRWTRWTLIAAVAGLLLVAAGAIGLRVATKALKGEIERALGPDAEVGEILVGWSAIEVRGLRIRAPKGWPAQDALRARRVLVLPDLRALLSGEARVNRVTVEEAYLSLLRSHDGKLRVVPSLLEREAGPAVTRAGKADTRLPEVRIGLVELRDSVLEFYDATLRRTPHRIRLEKLDARVEDLVVPGLGGRMRLKLEGVVKGVQRDGRLSVDGWAELATRDSEIATRLRGVDLIALQPYLLKATEAGVKRGTLDLDLKSVVRRNTLRAPGTLTLTGLELASGGGAVNTFMGLPRQAVLAAMKNRNDQITLRFVLEGDLNDPKFSLNESFAQRIGAGIAETLGVSFEGIARGVGEATRGIGETIRGLFGK